MTMQLGRLATAGALVGAMLAATIAPGWAQPPAGTLRLSWGTCDPQVQNVSLLGLASPLLVLVVSATDVSEPNSGTTVLLNLGPATVPDAWRFDAAGCQTSSRIHFSPAGLSESCPAMEGAGATTVTSASYDLNVSPLLQLRMANNYGAFTPSPTTRYTLWQIEFDTSLSDLVPPAEPDSCANGQQSVCISYGEAHLYTVAGPVLDFAGSFSGFQVTVNADASGDPCLVPTQPATWGRLKALYR